MLAETVHPLTHTDLTAATASYFARPRSCSTRLHEPGSLAFVPGRKVPVEPFDVQGHGQVSLGSDPANGSRSTMGRPLSSDSVPTAPTPRLAVPRSIACCSLALLPLQQALVALVRSRHDRLRSASANASQKAARISLAPQALGSL